MASEGIDTVNSSVSFTLPDQLENLILLGTATQGTGNAIDNSIVGNYLNNTLYGLDGNDFLDGQGGDDFMVGGFGNDTYVIQSLADMIDERPNAGYDLVRIRLTAANSFYIPRNVEGALIEEGFNIRVYGNELSNNIIGNTLENYFFGGDGNDCFTAYGGGDYLNGALGNDYLDGGKDADVLEGGLGNDLYIVDNKDDKIIELKSEGIDLVQADCNYTLTNNVESLILTGFSNIDGTGNNSDNLIKGNSGNNSLDGGLGTDILTGLSGKDVFKISTISSYAVSKADHITDFKQGEDKIEITAIALGMKTQGIIFNSVSSAKDLKANLASTNSIIYDSSSGYLYFNKNGVIQGAGKGGVFAILDNKAMLEISDISFI